MVPYPPRQLAIYSLPVAVLVAFFWYKRRRSLSRSDPGGTGKSSRTVDRKSTNLEGKELGEIGAAAPLKIEEEITQKVEDTDCDFGNRPETPLTTPEFEEEKVFHSTKIDDFKDLEESVSEDKPDNQSEIVEDVVEKVTAKVSESFQKLETIEIEDLSVKRDSIVEHHSIPFEEQSTVENLALRVETLNLSARKSCPDSDDTIPFEEQSTVENLALRVETFNLPARKSCPDSDDTLHSDKEDSSTSSDTVGKEENVSTDTGLGCSQDLSVAEEEPAKMAQGQKTEEKNVVELEHKLASLGLDTAPPAQRTERDSANHSPAEVMLNSPAISTYSDAHSEGSSDSGKGCSDVVTPPSRTPAGGSSVAGDQVPSIYEFVLPQVIVGRLIGRHGAFLQEIRAKTHTNVFIKRHPETNTLKICAIEGTQQDIDAALKMIRQKFPIRRFPDLTLERVTFVKNSCLPINPENLQLTLVEGVNNDVIISSLISAGHFFLQMPMHMTYQSLYKLTCIMNSVYNTHESPSLPDPKPDVVCVAPTHGGWYRAQIVSVDKDADSSEVKFLDYGGFLSVDNSSLRQIRGDFLLLPFQAVECVLANVLPAGGEEEWSEEAKVFVQQMTTQQVLQAQVYDYSEAGLPLVYLYCTQYFQSPADASVLEAGVVLLNQELVTRGFADLIEDLPPDEAQETVATVESS